MRPVGPALLLLFPLLAAGCLEGAQTPPTQGGSGDAEPLSFRSLDKGSFSGVRSDLREVLRSQAEWSALWARHKPNQSAPRVEFPNESVVAVVEHRSTGCFGVHVGNVSYDASARVLTVEVVHELDPPTINCLAAQVDVYHFVAIPDRPGEARFVDREEVTNATTSGGAYAFRTVEQGFSSGVHERTRRVILDEPAWRAFWAEHASYQAPPPEPPAVDFEREGVFVALAGDKPNTCWAERVESIDVQEATVRVRVVTYAPPPGVVCGQMVSQPFHFVTYPRTEKPVTLDEADATGPPPNV